MDVRKNIFSLNPAELHNFIQAVNMLKASGVYDQFVRRHQDAMMTATLLPGETGGSLRRNVAHRGPAFLPWHRQELRDFELALQAALPGAGVTLPYWDWAADAARPDPRTSPLWTDAYLGGDGDQGNNNLVPDGPFKNWTALIFNVVTNTLVPRSFPGLQRRLGRDPQGLPTLPTRAHVDSATDPNVENVYDSPPWHGGSDPSFRNRLEGWLLRPGVDPPGAGLHNRVHTWVGGDMLPGTSPNDPVFFLHHCNVDRIWAEWQRANPGLGYVPVNNGPPGHNLNDPMQFLSNPTSPAATLDHHALGYMYDSEPTLPTGPTAQGDDMQPGEVLNPNQSITSRNGLYVFVYQGDGNLVLYGPAGWLWDSQTDGRPVGVCIMQGDGNLVIYGPGGQYVWDSATDNNPGSHLVVQDDGNVVIYRPDNTAAWATNTVQP
jgi:Common central domain of tyrosinase